MIKPSNFTPIATCTVINSIITGERMTAYIATLLSPFELSIQQFNVLRILRGQKGEPTNLSTIQERMIHKMSNTTRLVDKLLQKELVTRNICTENRRKIEIYITQKGISLLAEVSPLVVEGERQMTSMLSDTELQQLNAILYKLNGAT